MKRIEVCPKTLLMDVYNIYNEIEQDLVSNSSEVIHRYDYYTKKYRGDLLNDVNVGIFINDNLKIVVQIYVSNINETIKTQLVYSNDGRRISAVDELINTYKQTMKIKVPVYTESKVSLEDRIKLSINEVLSVTDFNELVIINREIVGDDILVTLKGIK